MNSDQPLNQTAEASDDRNCDWCHGAGQVPQFDAGPVDCPVCKGTSYKGALHETTPEPRAGFGFKRETPTQQQREHAMSGRLHEQGDMLLIWV